MNEKKAALMTEEEVRKELGVSRTTFWKMRKVSKTFDLKPVNVGTRTVRYRRVDVERYLGIRD